MSPIKTKIYRVITTIDVEANNPKEAAHEAMLVMCGPNPPRKYAVAEKRRVDGEFIEIDLNED